MFDAEHLPRRIVARRAGHRGGFTIAEVMMAAAIMALAISTSITTMQRAFLALDSARNVTLASHIMQSELERMRLKSWDTINTYLSTPTNIALDASFTAATGNRFSLTRTATNVRNGMKRITFTVTWRGYDGRS